MTYLATPEQLEAHYEREKAAGRITRWKKLCDGLYIVERVLHNYNPQFIAAAGYFEWPF